MDQGHKRLVVRGDDIGAAHGINLGCIESFRSGFMKSVEVMVPCAWYPEAVTLLAENPDLDVGIHLTLTSEWDLCKWGPMTGAAGLCDESGYFYPTTKQRDDFPPGTAFFDGSWSINEVELELRAQIERAIGDITNISHLSTHMGTPRCTPELEALTEKLAIEYDLPYFIPGLERASHNLNAATDAAGMERAFIEMLSHLSEGLWLFVEHPAVDCPEVRALSHTGSHDVAERRQGVTGTFTSKRVQDCIDANGIEIISYAEALKL